MIHPDPKSIGQFFTPDIVADFMVRLASVGSDATVLDPACGDGVFLRSLDRHGFHDLTAYEIDQSLEVRGPGQVFFESFVTANLRKPFDLVIGNPPYVRWKNLDPTLKSELGTNPFWLEYCNSLSDYLSVFILKSVASLREGGELIFVTPEYWISTTHSQKLRDYLVTNGYFERIYHFCETKVFAKVTSSIVIFKFVRSRSGKPRPPGLFVKHDSREKLTIALMDQLRLTPEAVPRVEAFRFEQFQPGEQWAFANDLRRASLSSFEAKCMTHDGDSLFAEDNPRLATLGDIADIGNGLVSGLDRAFQSPPPDKLLPSELAALIPVLKAKSLRPFAHGPFSFYFLLNDKIASETQLRDEYPNLYRHLAHFRALLESRYSYGKGIPYWEWVFLRNFSLFRKPTRKIFVPCKERVSNKAHFRFAIAPENALPTQDVTAIVPKPQIRESVEYLAALLNHPTTFDWIMMKGVVKGNVVEFCEKPLARIPIRMIDWSNHKEADVHDQIVAQSQRMISAPSPDRKAELDELVQSLL